MNNIFNLQITPAVKNILYINIMCYLLINVIDYDLLIYNFGAFYFNSFRFKIWQIITYTFIHYDIYHLIFNMYALLIFGQKLEDRWGTLKFLQYYIYTGIGALVLHMLFIGLKIKNITGCFIINEFSHIPQSVFDIYNIPLIGSSGVIFGLLTAFSLYFPNYYLQIILFPIPIKSKYFIMIYMLFELYLGIYNFNGDKIAHFAHIGGIFSGYLIIKLWNIINY
ncbi:MAG: rhomboid family intramembrane serine protease [Bacteroides sp.]|nr:MAG: rhomboid family intramembrane serine protease [Bacteroides sp.]